jgi:hypothetical protein
MPLIAATEVPTALVTADELQTTGSCRLARIAGQISPVTLSDTQRRRQECNQNASVLIYVLPMYFSHALIGLNLPLVSGGPPLFG